MLNDTITREEIVGLLKTKPLALDLYERVSAYFGAHLNIVREWNPTKPSRLVVHIDDEQEMECRVDINLCTGHHKTPASLVHELLHLKMAMDGFPTFAQTSVPSSEDATELVKYALKILWNTLAHDIFISEFFRLGFAHAEFFFDLEFTADPEEQRRVLFSDLSWCREIDPLRRGFWSVLYFCQWRENALGYKNRMDECFTIGTSLFPGSMKDDDRWMRDWFECGEFRHPDKFSTSFTSFFKRLELPSPVYYFLERRRSVLWLVWRL